MRVISSHNFLFGTYWQIKALKYRNKEKVVKIKDGKKTQANIPGYMDNRCSSNGSRSWHNRRFH